MNMAFTFGVSTRFFDIWQSFLQAGRGLRSLHSLSECDILLHSPKCLRAVQMDVRYLNIYPLKLVVIVSRQSGLEYRTHFLVLLQQSPGTPYHDSRRDSGKCTLVVLYVYVQFRFGKIYIWFQTARSISRENMHAFKSKAHKRTSFKQSLSFVAFNFQPHFKRLPTLSLSSDDPTSLETNRIQVWSKWEGRKSLSCNGSCFRPCTPVCQEASFNHQNWGIWSAIMALRRIGQHTITQTTHSNTREI